MPTSRRSIKRPLVLVLFLLAAAPAASAQVSRCLPDGYTDRSIAQLTTTVNGRTITLAKALAGMRAACRQGKLIDGRHREIKLYQLQGCWGNPPADAQAILNSQEIELSALSKTSTVIRINCSSANIRAVSEIATLF